MKDRDQKLNFIADTLQSWIDYQGIATDDKKVMIVPEYPSVAVLKEWVKCLRDNVNHKITLRSDFYDMSDKARGAN